MKQVLQSSRTGEIRVLDVPVPAVPAGFVLVRTMASLVSAGTERMMVQFAEKNLAQKAMARPDLVRQVLEKVRRDGLMTTVNAVRSRLDEPMALGYSAVGTVIDAGPDVTDVKPGDRVACAGAGFANHAEVICVPRNLSVPIPDGVSFEDAAFVTLGAIALHGVRLAELQLGGQVAVIGLGLLGQLTVQLARASGCRVAGVDLLEDRIELARQLGADLAVTPSQGPDALRSWTAGIGVDAVLVTADTSSNDPIELAGVIARDRGTVVAVGAVGMAVPRRTYYPKELRFLISRSYGPGRYDPAYELQGHDYPLSYVRWTERRNLGSFLELVGAGLVKVAPLVTHRFPVSEATGAYDLITGKTPGTFLGVVLQYPSEPDLSQRIEVAAAAAPRTAASGSIGVLGAGSFASGTLLPAFKQAGAAFRGIASRQGLTARTCADRFGFAFCTTEERQVLDDPATDTIVVATRHDLHARQVLAARAAGKHVFVEKPLCISEDEMRQLADAYAAPGSPLLLVGFNRRFAPLAQELAKFFADAGEPLAVHYRVNAGYIPPDHWVHDPAIGGGRVIGEACHFIDFIGWLVRSAPLRLTATALPDAGRYSGDNTVITIQYDNGSAGTLTYVASGDKALGKERIEVHGGSRSAILDDFRQLDLFRGGRHRVEKTRLRQDKGHAAECEAFVRAIREGRPSPIARDEIFQTTALAFLALESARRRETLEVAR
jgi:predicted dehydrogenase/threonine dehydrogenase-like Zn-dependent dehydrogenase